MRILQIITLSQLGGAQTVVANLANKLSENHEVMVASGEGDGKLWDMLNPQVKKVQLKHLQRAVSPVVDVKAAWELGSVYNSFKPDVIHLHSSKAGMLGRMALPSKKIVYTVHGFDSIRVAFRKFLPIEKFMQRFCAGIVGVSNYDYAHLLEERINRNVSTIYNGIFEPNTAQLQQIPSLKTQKKRILCIARVSSPKRPDLFIEVAKRLPQYEFTWIGNLQEVTEFGALPSNCHFAGNIMNAGAYCSQADLFMLPSNYEGLPMVILEAMCFGKPVVASNVGGISEIVRDGVNGFALENDAELFAEKINYILQDESVYAGFSAKAKEIFQNELTVDKMVDGYMRLYQKIYDKCH